MKKCLLPRLRFFEFRCTLLSVTVSSCCVSQEAQEDQSETSQQTTSSDEDKGPETQVITSKVSWPSGSSLGNVHQLQLISDYRHDCSQRAMLFAFISLFPGEFDTSAHFLLIVCTVVSSWWLIAKWLTRNECYFSVSWEGHRSHAHLTPSDTPQYFHCTYRNWGAPRRRCSGNWIKKLQYERQKFTHDISRADAIDESAVVSVVISGPQKASIQHATDNHCENHISTHWCHPHGFPKNETRGNQGKVSQWYSVYIEQCWKVMKYLTF